jgi:putative ubiquitin-RnfH superfamily antitoxin RatB of RatAB toxin-antitoxin module
MASVEVGAPAMVSVLVTFGAAPRAVEQVALTLPQGATLADALRCSGLLERHGLSLDEHLSVGIWMKARPLDTVLREADRVEIYRPLRVDPKEARRQRFHRQTGKATKP